MYACERGAASRREQLGSVPKAAARRTAPQEPGEEGAGGQGQDAAEQQRGPKVSQHCKSEDCRQQKGRVKRGDRSGQQQPRIGERAAPQQRLTRGGHGAQVQEEEGGEHGGGGGQRRVGPDPLAGGLLSTGEERGQCSWQGREGERRAGQGRIQARAERMPCRKPRRLPGGSGGSTPWGPAPPRGPLCPGPVEQGKDARLSRVREGTPAREESPLNSCHRSLLNPPPPPHQSCSWCQSGGGHRGRPRAPRPRPARRQVGKRDALNGEGRCSAGARRAIALPAALPQVLHTP